VPVESARVEQAPIEPAQVEAAPVEFAQAEPVPEPAAVVEPASVEPASAEQASAEPVSVEQASVEQVSVEPASVEAAPSQPASVEVGPVSAAAARATPPDGIPQLLEVPAELPVPASQPIAVEAAAEPARSTPAPEFAREPETAAAPAMSVAPPAPPASAPAPVDRARLEHAHEPAQATAPVQETQNRAVPSIERALSGPSREQNPSWHGKVKIVTGAGASHGPGARDQEALDRNRARLDVPEPRRILVLGCTGGAGQTVTALMTGYMLASLREHPVAVVDLHDGTLARYRVPAAWLDEILAGRPPQQVTSSRPDGLNPTPKPSPARLDVIASHQQPREGDEIKLAVQLNRHYPLTVLDPGPSFLTRLLKVTDQLVVVVPANAEAAGALADTRDWLDNNGHAELAMQSVTVINGVSRRSLPDVEHAESIARGRSRAIVRIPWDDMLPVAAAGPSTLRPQTRVAYTALAGVLVAGLAAVPVRKKP
jgi:cellulose biosynthesis protein BcsQ